MVKLFHVLVVSAVSAYAQNYGTGSQADVGNFFERSITFLTTYVGGGVFVGGLVYTGILLAMHREDALKKGGMVIGGGVIMLLARVIWNVIKGLTG